jgi:tetratricopeptide (TPR) repeat protein
MTEEQLEKINFFESSLENETDSAKKIRLWHDYRNYFSYINPSFSLEIIVRGCEFAKSVSEEDYFNMLFSKSNSLFLLERYEEAFKILSNCLKFYIKINDNLLIVKVLGAISNIYMRLELLPQAIYIYNYILDNYSKIENKEILIAVKANLIQIYFNNFEKSPFKLKEIDELLESFELKKLTQCQAFLIISLTKSRFFSQNGEYEKSIFEINKVIKSAEEIESNIILNDAYYDLGILYKLMNRLDDMESAFLKSLYYSEKIGSQNFYIIIYSELHIYYSSKNLYKKALDALEKKNLYIAKYEEFRNKISSKSKLLGFSQLLKVDNELLNSLYNNINLEVKFDIYITDLKGNENVIKVQDIMYAQKKQDILKVQLAIGKPIYSNMNFKSFVSKIQSFEFYQKLFFETNVRSQIVNLFWMSKLDLTNKTISLKTIEDEFEIQISKRQFPILKKHILQFNVNP